MALFPGSSAVEQATVNRLAGGSNPSRGANFRVYERLEKPLQSKSSKRLVDFGAFVGQAMKKRPRLTGDLFGYNLCRPGLHVLSGVVTFLTFVALCILWATRCRSYSIRSDDIEASFIYHCICHRILLLG